MGSGLNLKVKRKCAIVALILGYLCFGMTIIFFYHKVNLLHNMETALDDRFKKIELMEGRIGKLHRELFSVSLTRSKRSHFDKNETTDSGLNGEEENDIDKESTGGEPTERPSCNIRCGATGGAIYTRWGRKTCNNATAELVYEGIVGNSHYTQHGGGVNPLCLPKNPLWNRYDDATQNLAFMYGTEYGSTILHAMFSLKNTRRLHEENIPCAVCSIKSGGNVMMVPARNVCYQGWNLEYQGYLMAGHHTHKKGSMFICVDEAPEVTESGYRNEDTTAENYYTVEAVCGALPCPEYVQGRELTCAVCSK